MSYKLICIDMDGTLFNSEKVISKRNKEALIAASVKGVKVVLASGRLYSFAVSYTDYTNENICLIATNGSYIRETGSERELYNKILPIDKAREVLRTFKRYDIPVAFFSSDSLFADYNSVMIKNYTGFNNILEGRAKVNINAICTNEQWEEVLLENKDVLLKAMVLEEDNERLKYAKKELALIKNVELTSSQPRSVEINALGVSKGYAVELVAEHYSIKREETICIGDGKNDISMIEYAGLGVAMNNGHRRLKEVAGYITDTNDEDGVAKVIERFVL